MEVFYMWYLMTYSPVKFYVQVKVWYSNNYVLQKKSISYLGTVLCYSLWYYVVSSYMIYNTNSCYLKSDISNTVKLTDIYEL